MIYTEFVIGGSGLGYWPPGVWEERSGIGRQTVGGWQDFIGRDFGP